jgi:Transposase DDE domain group 1
LLQRAERESEALDGERVRLVSEAPYQAGRWDCQRRVLYKAEVLEKGMNTRFVVTSKKKEEPEKLYDW